MYRSLEDIFVFIAPGRVDNAKEHQRLMAGILDPLHRTGWNLDRVTRIDLGRFIVDMHSSVTTDDEIDLVGCEPVAVSLVAGVDRGVGQRVAGLKRVVALGMEQFAEPGVVAGDKLGSVF